MKSDPPCSPGSPARRSPYGERGLKLHHDQVAVCQPRSLPVRGAWIEILCLAECRKRYESLPVRGAWIEIIQSMNRESWLTRSLPVRGAWIEILISGSISRNTSRRSPYGERGLKSDDERQRRGPGASLPVRGAWIEIYTERGGRKTYTVAPRTGSVD